MAELRQGQTIMLTAAYRLSDGTSAPASDVVWTVVPVGFVEPTIGSQVRYTVQSDVTLDGATSVTITATGIDGITGSITITVTSPPPVVTGLEITAGELE